ncbi:MAG: M23 family metallopeptidase, partial [Solirubrobacterales bacterium]|nr:M23 family metallopeptidase [Solirubrobacterales bacterium]
MTTRTLRFLALSLTALLFSPLTSEADQWQWPLARHQLSERFDFDRSDPYRAGARRGITLSGQPGAKVRAVCSGVVSFAGPLPDGRRGVTLRCGGLAATELGLQQSEVSGGETVIAGQPLGSLGPGALLSVGARLMDERNGYRDPLALLAAPPTSLPLAPLAPRGRGIPPAPRPAPR